MVNKIRTARYSKLFHTFAQNWFKDIPEQRGIPIVAYPVLLVLKVKRVPNRTGLHTPKKLRVC